jgi:hypothetical protein
MTNGILPLSCKDSCEPVGCTIDLVVRDGARTSAHTTRPAHCVSILMTAHVARGNWWSRPLLGQHMARMRQTSRQSRAAPAPLESSAADVPRCAGWCNTMSTSHRRPRLCSWSSPWSGSCPGASRNYRRSRFHQVQCSRHCQPGQLSCRRGSPVAHQSWRKRPGPWPAPATPSVLYRRLECDDGGNH